MKKTLLSLLIASSLIACKTTNENIKLDATPSQPINNVIMIVADGMGPAFTTAYRYYADDKSTPEVEASIFDSYLVGQSSTFPDAVSGYVTDSAASATALASGIKSYNGAIGVDANKKPVETVLHRAKSMGMKTGVVVTSQVNHATPASYITHNESRRNYDQIANSYIDNGINVDVLLGGGWQYFIREDRNIVDEFKSAGFTYVDSYEDLEKISPQSRVLGLFDDVGLPAAIDDKDPTRLLTMTKAALPQLENDAGFFLLVEASQVDWAAHSNDINSAMAEMKDLAATFEYLSSYVKNNPNTQVILTADHSTGGFTIAANGEYIWQPELLTKLTQSNGKLAEYFISNDVTKESLSANLANSDISDDMVILVQDAKQKALDSLEKYQTLSTEEKQNVRQPKPAMQIGKAINKVIDKLTNTGWTTSGHTAVDVPVYAIGSRSADFAGHLDNTDIAKKIFNLLDEKAAK